MGLKTILFLGLFGFCTAGALVSPILGVLGYSAHYAIGPEGQWWSAPIRHWGIRYSFILAAATAVGMALNWRKLRFGGQSLLGHEKLVILFLAVVWLVTLVAPETVGRYTTVDHPAVKFTKVVVFTLMLTHVVTSVKNLDRLLWVLVIAALILGLQAWDTPRRAFIKGRLEGVGGPDFTDANFFAAYMATMLPIIGVQFLRSKWVGKVLCLAAGAFTANAIILTRSRGAMVGVGCGCLAAAILAPKRQRLKIAIGLIVAVLGGLYLTDPQFRERTGTVTRSEEERDTSAQSRVRLALAGLEMLRDHPFGVGVGNFYQNIGHYIPEYPGKDAHNTYVRCFTETGIIGIAVFGAIILSALSSLRNIIRQAERLPAVERGDISYLGFGLLISLVTLLGCCLTMSLTYVEFTWWLLMLPVCLRRAMNNLSLVPAREDDGGIPGVGRSRWHAKFQARRAEEVVT